MKRLIASLVVAVCFSLPGRAKAAPLTYTISEQVSLTLPAVTLTIATDSVAGIQAGQRLLRPDHASANEWPVMRHPSNHIPGIIVR